MWRREARGADLARRRFKNSLHCQVDFNLNATVLTMGASQVPACNVGALSFPEPSELVMERSWELPGRGDPPSAGHQTLISARWRIGSWTERRADPRQA